MPDEQIIYSSRTLRCTGAVHSFVVQFDGLQRQHTHHADKRHTELHHLFTTGAAKHIQPVHFVQSSHLPRSEVDLVMSQHHCIAHCEGQQELHRHRDAQGHRQHGELACLATKQKHLVAVRELGVFVAHPGDIRRQHNLLRQAGLIQGRWQSPELGPEVVQVRHRVQSAHAAALDLPVC